MTGLLIALEGPEGAGKSTQIRHLAAALTAAGHRPLLTREPGGTVAGEKIRAVILDPELRIEPLTEFLLYSASRAQHVAEVIRPALDQGRVVVTDRFSGASVAYQGYGRGLDHAFVEALNRRTTGGLAPQLTILLDIDPEAGLARVANRGRRDRLERADLAFHRKVREGFLAQAGADSRWLVLDATLPEGRLAGDIWAAVSVELGRLDETEKTDGQPS